MTEQALQGIAILKGFFVFIFGALYSYGGLVGTNKEWRRSGCPTVMGLGVIGFSLLVGSFSYLYLIYIVLLALGLRVGYGANNISMKVIKRGYYALGVSLPTLPLAIVNGQWLVFVIHVLLCITVSILFGVINPVNARYEETIIGTSIGLLPLFMI